MPAPELLKTHSVPSNTALLDADISGYLRLPGVFVTKHMPVPGSRTPLPPPSASPASVALHIAYLSRNYETASELLEHGASTALRDNFGKTAQQMLELSKPVRRRFASACWYEFSSRVCFGVFPDHIFLFFFCP